MSYPWDKQILEKRKFLPTAFNQDHQDICINRKDLKQVIMAIYYHPDNMKWVEKCEGIEEELNERWNRPTNASHLPVNFKIIVYA